MECFFFRPDHFLLSRFSIACLVLLAISVLSAVDSSAQIKLAWDPNTEPDLAGYRVYYGTASGIYGTSVDVGNVTAYTLNGLAQGVTYYLTVIAYDTARNESGYSNEVSGRITESVSAPNVLSGPTAVLAGTPYTYVTGGSLSSLGHPLQYQFDWKGDGSDLSPWGPATQSKTWTAPGAFNVRARARCVSDASVISQWVGSLSGSITQPTLSYTVSTNPAGLQITVDGLTYTAPQTFHWAAGSSHSLSIPSPQSLTSDTRYIYSSWNDGGTRSHAITAQSSTTAYTANLLEQYRLTTSVNPSGAGSIYPSGPNWYSRGQKVFISATAKPGYSFSGWSGNLSGTSNPTPITLDSPKNVTANFTPRKKWR
jgi:uncharacterized repeat protein (TIGR02543 family)